MYAFGVLLEWLLLETSLCIVVLDFNLDYVCIVELRDGVAFEDFECYCVVVLIVVIYCGDGLWLWFVEFGIVGCVVVLWLDLIEDCDEYVLLVMLLEQISLEDFFVVELVDFELVKCVCNLGVDCWGVWVCGVDFLFDVFEDDLLCCVVYDIGLLVMCEE